MELAQQLYETSSQSDVVVRFFTLKHEALMDYDFLRELINLQEFNTKQKCPTLFITYVDGAIRCLCYVPEASKPRVFSFYCKFVNKNEPVFSFL